jgi:hypothetical protein
MVAGVVSQEGAGEDRGRWTTAAVVVVGCFATVASLVLALSYFFIGVVRSIGYHGDTPPATDAPNWRRPRSARSGSRAGRSRLPWTQGIGLSS